MKCKVRYFFTYYMHLVLKYIFILFITCSREAPNKGHIEHTKFCHAMLMSCKQTTFCEDTKGKETEVTTKEVVANVYDYFKELNRCQQTQGPLKRIADITGVSCASIKRLQKEKVDRFGGAAFPTHSSFFVKRFFSEPRWFIVSRARSFS